MIISHKHKFIFVKTRKTAGTSIEIFLSSLCHSDDVFTRVGPSHPLHVPRNYSKPGCRNYYTKHMSAKSICKLAGQRIWDDYFTFCVERNPWDKTISHYYMHKFLANGKMEFADYMNARQFCVDHGMYTDEDGQIMVDRVVQYENLSSELADVFTQLGIPFDGDLSVRVKSQHREHHGPYQEMFSDEEHQLAVAVAFKRERALFGYTFSNGDSKQEQ